METISRSIRSKHSCRYTQHFNTTLGYLTLITNEKGKWTNIYSYMITSSRSYLGGSTQERGLSGSCWRGLRRFKAMALVSTPVSCRKAFVRVGSAASKENSPKMGIFSINLNSEAFSSEGRNKIQGREPPSPPLEKGDYAIWLMTLYGPKALGGVIWTRKILVHKPHNTIKTQKHFFFI